MGAKEDPADPFDDIQEMHHEAQGHLFSVLSGHTKLVLSDKFREHSVTVVCHLKGHLFSVLSGHTKLVLSDKFREHSVTVVCHLNHNATISSFFDELVSFPKITLVENNECQPLNKRHLEDYPRYPVRSLSIRSQPEDPCFSCLRTAVHCYNIVILILGLGVLGVGIWLLVTEYSAREVTVLVGSNLFEIGTYLMIGGGGTIALLAFCGCCGTMREDRCVLAFYGVTISIVLLALIAGSALAFIFRGELSGQVKDNIVQTLAKGYGIDEKKNSQNRLITDAWNSLQRSLQCCGAYGGINSSHSWAFYKQHSDWYLVTNNRAPYVPDSCCSGNKQICNGIEQIEGPPSKGPPVYSSYVKNEHLYTEGCYEKVMVHLERNALILGGVAACVPLLLIIGIVVVFCMCARVHKDDIDDEDDV